MLDLYRRENAINYDFKDAIEKRYFIIPLRLSAPTPDQMSPDGTERVRIRYEVDSKLLEKTERLYMNGYKQEQPNVIEWLRGKGLLGSHATEAQNALLKKWMLVKEDKPNSCYHFDMLLQDLEHMSAEDFAVAIRGEPKELNCTVAHDLLWSTPTRFKSVNSFREMIHDKHKLSPETL